MFPTCQGMTVYLLSASLSLVRCHKMFCRIGCLGCFTTWHWICIIFLSLLCTVDRAVFSNGHCRHVPMAHKGLGTHIDCKLFFKGSADWSMTRLTKTSGRFGDVLLCKLAIHYLGYGTKSNVDPAPIFLMLIDFLTLCILCECDGVNHTSQKYLYLWSMSRLKWPWQWMCIFLTNEGFRMAVHLSGIGFCLTAYKDQSNLN